MDRTLILLTAASAFAVEQPALLAEDKPGDFAREILPVLSDKCFVCHGPDTKKKDLVRLDSFEGATRALDGLKAINLSLIQISEPPRQEEI